MTLVICSFTSDFGYYQLYGEQFSDRKGGEPIMPKRDKRDETNHSHAPGEWCFASKPLLSASALEVASLNPALLLASIEVHEGEFRSQLAALPADLGTQVTAAAIAAGWVE